MDVVNPYSGEQLQPYAPLGAHEIEPLLARLAAGQGATARLSFTERSLALRRLASALESAQEELAHCMAREMGKPVREGRKEVQKSAWVCRFYADSAEEFLTPRAVPDVVGQAQVRFEPLGAILAIMPWNFPVWQLMRFAAPALAAGNAVALKHAPCVWGLSARLCSILSKASHHPDWMVHLPIDHGELDAVLQDGRIRAVTFTGSTGAGRVVAGAAGRALKKSVLELGGSDPFIVCADADLEAAAEAGAQSRLLNAGQSCIAAKRMIVEDAVYEPFREALVEAFRGFEVSDPLDEDARLGPLAREDLRQHLHTQVSDARADGARVLTGGAPDPASHAGYPPTVLEGVNPNNRAWRQELFGPVALLARVGDRAQALRWANDSEFGLGASIWTADAQWAQRAAGALDVGNVFINRMTVSDPRLPFGGVKASGYGRELGPEGIKEFVNVKTVCRTPFLRNRSVPLRTK